MMKSLSNDTVNHPAHYTQGGIECIDAIEAAVGELSGIEAVCTGNAIKYLWRWKQKNGIEKTLDETVEYNYCSIPIINAVLQQKKQQIEQNAIAFEADVTISETGMIEPVHLCSIFSNLLDNAIKFSHHNSTITIETREKHNKLFVSVKDTGIGIPKDSLKLIFDRFYKTDLSRGKDKKGTGLGLSITKEIIHAHGEHINVISTEGVGSEFIFTLAEADTDDD